MTTFVLFGGTGDLAQRKIIPALYSAFLNNRLNHFQVYGAAREALTDDQFRARISAAITNYSNPVTAGTPEQLNTFLSQIFYIKIDANIEADFKLLKSKIPNPSQHCTLFYLATRSDLFIPIVQQLSNHQLVGDHARVILEKPLGHDAQSARHINQTLSTHLKENQIYRIDHYLGKEMVQNLLALRFANLFLEPLWNRTWIHDVQISIAEQVGVEARGDFFDHTGTLRDMVQNHLLQLLSIVAMEAPVNAEPNSIRDEKVKILHALHKLTPDEINKKTVRGQYRAGTINGQSVVGYQNEPGVAPHSRTETFVAIRAEIDNWRWAGVPFYLRTGKRMTSRSAEITINFKPIPYSIFGANLHHMRSNRLVISLQPEESVQLFLKAKEPGEGVRLSEVALNLDFAEASTSRRVEAHERLLLDAIRGDLTLFVRDDELAAAWEWIDPIISAWQADTEGLKSYIAGSWGPPASSHLLAQYGSNWGEEFVEN